MSDKMLRATLGDKKVRFEALFNPKTEPNTKAGSYIQAEVCACCIVN